MYVPVRVGKTLEREQGEARNCNRNQFFAEIA
jgi:hypothetical protein